jgi:hypothetical protein
MILNQLNFRKILKALVETVQIKTTTFLAFSLLLLILDLRVFSLRAWEVIGAIYDFINS